MSGDTRKFHSCFYECNTILWPVRPRDNGRLVEPAQLAGLEDPVSYTKKKNENKNRKDEEEKMNGHIQARAGHLNDKARNPKSLDTERAGSHPTHTPTGVRFRTAYRTHKDWVCSWAGRIQSSRNNKDNRTRKIHER